MTITQSSTAAPSAGVHTVLELRLNEGPRHSGSASSARAFYGGIGIILFCALALSLTEPRFYADTANYALHIVQHSQRHPRPGQDPLWDFGHVLWKPLGYMLWHITS